MLALNKLDTICALSTPQGMSAIAVIRLTGQEAITTVNKCFTKDISKANGYTVHYGSILDQDKVVDDVIVTIFRGPNSFTGENTVEIACHGSTFIQQRIIETLLQNGARLAEAGEFSKRAFFNGKFDLSQTEAIADLIHSQSEAAHKIAIQQMRGGFSNDLKELRAQLIHFASLVELELDFAEEDVEFADRTELITLVQTVFELVQRLVQSFKLGNAIKNGVNTAIVGRPNAGKSTLLNAILNEERAIVSDIAGTTRDTIEESVILEGVEFRFIDTAGLRKTTDAIEKIGVEKALNEVEKSAVYIYLFDCNDLSVTDVEQDLAELPNEIAHIVVANKLDLATENQITSFKNSDLNPVFISAKDNNAINELQKQLLNTVDISSLSSNQTIVTNIRHFEALKRAEGDLQKVKDGLHNGISGDFIAMDIRQALHHLGTITGEVSTDDLLGNIFANFCIGK